MSVRLLSLPTANPTATAAIPSPSKSGSDTFEKVFADSRRSQGNAVRDDSAAASDDRSSTQTSSTRDTSEPSASEKANANTKADDTKDVNRSEAHARENEPANTDREVAENTEKQAKNGTHGESADADASGVTEVKPVPVEQGEPVVLPVPTLETGDDAITPDEVLSADDDVSEDTESDEADSEADDATLNQQIAHENQTVDVNEATQQVAQAVSESEGKPVESSNSAAQAQYHKADESASAQRVVDSESIEQRRDVLVQSETGSQTDGDSDGGTNTASGESLSSEKVSNTSSGRNGAFQLPGAVVLPGTAGTDLSATALPVPIAVEQTSGNVATPVPIALPDTPELRDEANIARISRGLESAVNQRGGNITIRLDPPELGQVRIEMDVRDGVVNARFTAQAESVRRLLMDQMGQLRNALDRQGLSIEKLDVQTASNQNQSWNSQQENSHDGRSKGQHSRRQSQGQNGKQGADAQPDTFETQLNHAE